MFRFFELKLLENRMSSRAVVAAVFVLLHETTQNWFTKIIKKEQKKIDVHKKLNLKKNLLFKSVFFKQKEKQSFWPGHQLQSLHRVYLRVHRLQYLMIADPRRVVHYMFCNQILFIIREIKSFNFCIFFCFVVIICNHFVDVIHSFIPSLT